MTGETERLAVVETTLGNIEKFIEKVPSLIEASNNAILHKLDIILGGQHDTLQEIKESLKEGAETMKALQLNDHKFELSLKDYVPDVAFRNYAAEKREEDKIRDKRLESLEKSRTWITGGWAVAVIIMGIIMAGITLYFDFKNQQVNNATDNARIIHNPL